MQSITAVTGINLELLGQQDQNQPGIVEHMRKQAGMTVLATMFDALRGFLKIIGRKRLFFIQTRVAEGTMVRVAGPEFASVVQVTKDKTTGTFDVVVDDAPTSPNVKEANWTIMQPLLAAFKDQLVSNPEMLILALEYSPLPAAFVDAMKKALAKQQASDPGQQQWQETMKQLAIAKLTAEINKDQSTAEMNNAKAGATNSTATYDLAMAQNLLAKNDIQGFNHHITAMGEAAKAELNKAKAAQTIIETHKTAQQAGLDRQQHASDMMGDATDRATSRHQAAIDTVGAVVDHHQALTDRLHAHIAARQQHIDAMQAAGEQQLKAQELQPNAQQVGGDQQLKSQGLRQQDQHNQRTSAIDRMTAQAGLMQAQQPEAP